MVMLLHSRTSAAFLAADLKQARVDAVTAAANQAFVQRIPVPSWASVRLLLFTAHSTHTDRVGFEPTVPLRAHRFSRPAVSTAHAPVQQARRTGAQTHRRTDTQTHRHTDTQTHKTARCVFAYVCASTRLCVQLTTDRVGFEPTK